MTTAEVTAAKAIAALAGNSLSSSVLYLPELRHQQGKTSSERKQIIVPPRIRQNDIQGIKQLVAWVEHACANRPEVVAVMSGRKTMLDYDIVDE